MFTLKPFSDVQLFILTLWIRLPRACFMTQNGIGSQERANRIRKYRNVELEWWWSWTVTWSCSISEFIGFALLHSVIGLKFSRHFFNQSEVKPKPIVARACTFSRALCRLRVTTSSFDWFTGLYPFFLIGQSNYFGFGFTTLDWNLLSSTY